MQAIETLPWGVDRVDADVAHADGYTGSGADIAILDTGIDSDHPDLEANLGAGKAYVDSTSGSEPWDDDQGHGTHCAGIADAVDNGEGVIGVSTAATLHAVKVLDSSGYGYYSDIAAGLEWSANQGYDVASLSLGGSADSSTIRNACQYAVDNGVLVVAAAGNDGTADSVRYPAKYDTVIAVSATDSSDGLAYFSSYGPEVELAAPGYSIYATVPGGYGSKSGTSMACPHVAGAGGQLMATGLSNGEARQTLRDTAEDIGLSGNEQGYGLLDVGAALEGGGDSTAPTTPSDLSSTGTTSTSVELAWEASSDDGSGVDHYNVYVDGAKRTETTGTSVTVGGLESGTSYDVSVSAVDGAGNESGRSDPVTATTDTGGSAVGEAGSVTTNQPDFTTWHAVDFENSYSDPVVVMDPLSYNGGNPSHVRLRRVGPDGFEFRIEEWVYLDGWHTEETVSYLVMEAGEYTLSDGTTVEVGSVDAGTSFTSVSFSETFEERPVVLSQSRTVNDGQSVVVRQRNVTTTGFEARLEEEENLGPHAEESVGYIALDPSTRSGSPDFEVDTTGTTVTDDWSAIDFDRSFGSTPLFVARMQTTVGWNTAGVRYRNLTSAGVEVFVEEEESRDQETGHVAEDIGYLVFEPGTTVRSQ